MNHNVAINYTIVLTTDDIVNLFSMEAGGFDYWGEICCSNSAYTEARKRIQAASPNEKIICYEEVYANVLENGGNLFIMDREENKKHPLTFESLEKAICFHIQSGGEMNPENWDCVDADAIMQYVAFGEITYS